MNNIICVIPARGGSTGIPGKNIKDFCGKPLIAYTIMAARESGVFERIIVTTDSEDIAAVAREYGAEVPYLRPAELATPTSDIADTVIHLLDYLKEKEGYEPATFFLLQPTSPLRDASDILASLEIFKRSGGLPVISVCKTHAEIFRIREGVLVKLAGSDEELINRQELPATYKQDGSMIYILNVNWFRREESFSAEGAVPYVVPKWKAVDIDDPEDFELAEALYRSKDSFKTRLTS
jgi:CMP-N-acetylneuraminic acid synthetase